MAEWLTQGYRWQRARFRPVLLQELSRTGTALLASDMAMPVWRAEFVSDALPLHKAQELEATLESLGGARETLLVHTAERCRPLLIRSGGLSQVRVRSISADNDHIALTGMPAGARVSIGDFLAVLTKSGGRELIKARGSVTANENGITPPFRLTQHLRPGVRVDDPVQMVNPRMEARIEPGSLDMPQVGGRSYTITFTALQEIR